MYPLLLFRRAACEVCGPSTPCYAQHSRALCSCSRQVLRHRASADIAANSWGTQEGWQPVGRPMRIQFRFLRSEMPEKCLTRVQAGRGNWSGWWRARGKSGQGITQTVGPQEHGTTGAACDVWIKFAPPLPFQTLLRHSRPSSPWRLLSRVIVMMCSSSRSGSYPGVQGGLGRPTTHLLHHYNVKAKARKILFSLF